MSVKNNLNFNDGYKEFTINNDPERVIRFNPSDIGIIGRFDDASNALEKLVKEFSVAEEIDEKSALAKLDTAIKEQVDYVFNYPVSEVVFGKQSPMSPVGGKMLFEQFFDAVKPVITDAIKTEKEASQQRVEKYVNAAHGK